jgi:hypothetical protein
MASDSKGIVGSIAVHVGIVAVLVGASWYAARQSGKSLEPVDPLLVDLNGIPGRRPGEVGKADGVAQGQETGTKKGISIIKIKKFDFEKNTKILEYEKFCAIIVQYQADSFLAKSATLLRSKSDSELDVKFSFFFSFLTFNPFFGFSFF